MRRMILLLALLLLPALPAYAQPALSARVTQVDSSHYPDVTLYVSVTDAAGRPAGGLAATDFSISEDGQNVDLSSFVGGGASPVATALLIDRSASMEDRDKIGDAQDAARAFVGQMRPGDRTALIAFSSRPQTIQEFTADQPDLLRAIGRVRPDGGTAIYDSVIAGVDALKDSAGRRVSSRSLRPIRPPSAIQPSVRPASPPPIARKPASASSKPSRPASAPTAPPASPSRSARRGGAAARRRADRARRDDAGVRGAAVARQPRHLTCTSAPWIIRHERSRREQAA